MPVTRTDRNEEYRDGKMIASVEVVVDVTADAVHVDLHTKARQALTDNATFLAIATPTAAQVAAQVKRLTRQQNAVIRLLLATDGARDLLTDNTDT